MNACKLFSIITASIVFMLAVTAADAGGPDVAPMPAQPIFHHAYVNVQIGYSFVNYTNATLRGGVTATKIENNGWSPKLALGYDFTHHFGVELGVNWFHKPAFYNLPTFGPKYLIKNNVVYLVGKVNISLWKKLSAYLKGGVGYVARSGITTGTNIVALQSGNFVMPVYGVGLLYSLTPRWDFDASFMQVPCNSAHQLPTSNFAGVGVSFRFL